MKIAFLSPAWPVAQAQNGIATYVDIMTRALRKAGHECVVITPNLIGADNERDVFQIGPIKQPIWEKAAKAIRRRISGEHVSDNKPYARAIAEAIDTASQTGPIDIVEIEESFGHSYHLQKLLAAPVVIRLHGPHFLVHQGKVEKCNRQRIDAEGVAMRTSQAVTCPSRSVLDKVASYYNLDEGFGTAIPNPVEITANAWRLDACNHNMLLFVGRFDSTKGADIMLSTFSGLAARYTDLKLLMLGKDVGIERADGRVQHFEEYARAHLDDDVLARVEFLGPVSRARADELRREALICISASRFESFSYAVTEALALGCPVVASATAGLTEYLRADKDLLLANINDREGLEARISSLIEHPEMARQLGATGRQTAIAQLSPESIATKSLNFYQHVIAGNLTNKAEQCYDS
jgi:glycosyltransferase involved in cell wall biosynthesis